MVQAYSGFEQHVKRSLQERINPRRHHRALGQILVPTEEVVKCATDRSAKSERKFFPGYVLVQMEMTTRPGTGKR